MSSGIWLRCWGKALTISWRSFVFPSSEIYGGLGSTYDYGHYGVLLKTNVKNEWWRAMLRDRDDIVALIATSAGVMSCTVPPGVPVAGACCSVSKFTCAT